MDFRCFLIMDNLDKVNTINGESEFLIVDGNQTDTVKKIKVSDVTNSLIYANSNIQGDKGDPGIKGLRGRTGAKGEPGEIGSKGEPGEKGVKGVRGIQGDLGEIGLKGSKGLTGESGIKGSVGDKGETGPVGFVGQSGEKGTKGVKGIRADRGKTGPKGERGIKGESGDILNGIGSHGDVGDVGEPGAFGIRGERGLTGKVGSKGSKGLRGHRGNSATQSGLINHALFGAKLVRDWVNIDITPGPYIHLSYFKNGSEVSYKFIKLVLEVPPNDNILDSSCPLVVTLINHGQITDFIPVLHGQPPVVWIKSETDDNNSIEDRYSARTPRNIVLNTHQGGDHIGVYLPTNNSQFISEKLINLNVIEMYGTNDI